MNFHPRPYIVERSEYVPATEAETPMIRVINAFVDDFFLRHNMKGWKVLDAGCGRQPFRKKFEDAGCSYTSMDVNQNPEGSVHYLCAIDEPLPDALKEAGPFDLLFCLEVLEHVADWDAAFGNFSHLLKKGGRILITTPHFFYLHEEPYDFWRPTVHIFDYYANRYGLSIVKLYQGGDPWDVIDTILLNGKIEKTNGSYIDRARNYLLRKVLVQLTKGVIRRKLQKYTTFKQKYYLSNGIELVK